MYVISDISTIILGLYEVYEPAKSLNGFDISLKRVLSGEVSTAMIAGPFSMAGVNISCLEQYKSIVNSNTEVNSLLITETRSMYDSTSFRTSDGNQIVGSSYTLSSASNELRSGIPSYYVHELAIKEDSMRTRVRYLYENCKDDVNAKKGALTSEEMKFFDMSLTGFTIIRERLSGLSSQPLDFDESTLGLDIYDPQESGEPYVMRKLPGRLTLFFPRGLKVPPIFIPLYCIVCRYLPLIINNIE